MYIIKHKSRRRTDAPGTYVWIINGGSGEGVVCMTLEAAVELMFGC